jgi:hypothetical protein
MLVVAGKEKPLEKQVLVADTKQGSQACLLCFAPATSALLFFKKPNMY